MSRTPWADLLAAGLRMGLSPDAFWRLSLREWRCLGGMGGGAAPFGSADFKQLMERFPDAGERDGEQSKI